MFIAQHIGGTIYKGFTLSRIDDMLYNHQIDNGSAYSEWLVVEANKELKSSAELILETYHNDGYIGDSMPTKEAQKEYDIARLRLK
jgi:hypothetical protein